VTWSLTEDVEGRDVFHIQDTLTKRIVESLKLPLSAGEKRALARDVPANAMAYELFLRANRLAEVGSDLAMARDLYLKSLEADPNYAPTWVRLARRPNARPRRGLPVNTPASHPGRHRSSARPSSAYTGSSSPSSPRRAP